MLLKQIGSDVVVSLMDDGVLFIEQGRETVQISAAETERLLSLLQMAGVGQPLPEPPEVSDE